MMLSVPTATVSVKLTKIAYRTRYDVPGYESGGLPYGYADKKGDGYLVSLPDGTALGCVYKWSDGEWTASKIDTAAAPALPPWEYAFSCLLYSGKTRTEAVANLVKYTKGIY